jgi:hypothetical protein
VSVDLSRTSRRGYHPGPLCVSGALAGGGGPGPAQPDRDAVFAQMLGSAALRRPDRAWRAHQAECARQVPLASGDRRQRLDRRAGVDRQLRPGPNRLQRSPLPGCLPMHRQPRLVRSGDGPRRQAGHRRGRGLGRGVRPDRSGGHGGSRGGRDAWLGPTRGRRGAGVYTGNPAVRVRERIIRDRQGPKELVSSGA